MSRTPCASKLLRRSRLLALAAAMALALAGLAVRAQAADAGPGSSAAAPRDSAAAGARSRGNPNFVTVLLSDLGYVVSSPARMNRHSLAWTAGIAGAAALVYANDQEILDATQRAQGNGVYDALVGDVGDFIEPVGNMGNTNAFYVAGWAAGHAFHVRGLQVVPFEILESHMISGGIRNVAEQAVGRFRPYSGRGPRHFDPGNATSFPSGHASVGFELATIVSHHARSRPVSFAAYGLATLLAVQRVDSKSHWPSDAFVGAVTGHVIARTIVQRQDRREDERRARVSLVPDPHGVRIAVAF